MKVNLPLVIVIVPNYNHYNYLDQRWQSFNNQDYPNFKVILLDDCSTDSSPNILGEYAKNTKVSHCIFNKANSGNTFIHWNKGITLAKRDYIVKKYSRQYQQQYTGAIFMNLLIDKLKSESVFVKTSKDLLLIILSKKKWL